MTKGQLRKLIREEIERRLNEAKPTEASAQAKKLGLTYLGFGRWADETGNVVANTIDGKLVQKDTPEKPEEVEDDTYDLPDFGGEDDLKKGGHWRYQGTGAPGINPGWNKGLTMAGDDIAFDANADKTVEKLLAKVGDPAKLLRWLVKKFAEETPNGKKRIAQYIGILEKMGVTEEPAGEAPAAAAPASNKPRRHDGDLFVD
ncbi:MAG: hypothetical protein KY428_11085 [Bacteroidetes bacterium]|nr:hypothetical protein [Bacteroidota bacterium]